LIDVVSQLHLRVVVVVPSCGCGTTKVTIEVSSELSVKGKLRVCFRYPTRCINFFQSLSVALSTRVVRNAIAVQVSGLARLVAYNVFVTTV
jgi:hypothetical protein